MLLPVAARPAIVQPGWTMFISVVRHQAAARRPAWRPKKVQSARLIPEE